jgi:hypothetical protein
MDFTDDSCVPYAPDLAALLRLDLLAEAAAGRAEAAAEDLDADLLAEDRQDERDPRKTPA